VRIYEQNGCSSKQYRHLGPHTPKSFPYGCVPVSGTFQSGHFLINSYMKWTKAPAISSTIYTPDLQQMHHEILTSVPLATIAAALWEGQAILGTDGSVIEQKATYSWIISTTLDAIVADAHGGGFLPPPAWYYTEHSLKRYHNS
jgi:hypothetical protein